MTWEVSTILGVFALPIMTTFMTNRTLTKGEGAKGDKPQLFYWLKILLFLFNFWAIDLGLWVAREISVGQSTNVTTLLTTLWRVYTGLAVFITVVMVIVILFDTLRDMFGAMMARR